MKLHSTIGARILSGSNNELLMMAERIALTHHERWDGLGYPHGRTGEDIPLPGRIVSVADVFDALTHRRPYKEAWPIAEATQEILGASGTKFDPHVVEAFARLDHASLVQPAVQPARLAAGRGRARTTRARRCRRRSRIAPAQLISDSRSATATACVRVLALQLRHRVLHMRAHRQRRDRERASRLLVAHALGQEPEDVALALGQREHALGRCRPGEHSGEGRVDIAATGCDDADRPQQLVERCLLEDEAPNAGVERRQQQGPLRIGRVEHDRGRRLLERELRGDVDAADAGHADVEQGDLGRVLVDQSQDALAVVGAADELEPALALEEPADGVEDRRDDRRRRRNG